MKDSFVERRNALRLKLQTNRQLLLLQGAAAAPEPAAFPHSMTMRLLLGKSDLGIVLFTEIVALLLRFTFARTARKS